MMQTGGLTILVAWLIFAALLTLLAAMVLRHPADIIGESRRRADGSPDEVGADRTIDHTEDPGRGQ